MESVFLLKTGHEPIQTIQHKNTMTISYKTNGTCSSRIEVEVENNIIRDICFTGGCNGNLKGICSLVKGMDIHDVITKLEGIRCGNRNTSCPDQLCKALKTIHE